MKSKSNTTCRVAAVSLPIATPKKPSGGSKAGFGRWRAASLSLVYLLIALHFLHWKFAGRTLAPLELSETMETLELGVVTAGFVLMIVLVVGTLVAGRFFCSWVCHIVALQDLCAWLLKKLHIKPITVRSRLLLWAPLVIAAYMFAWPQVERVWRGDPPPTFRVQGLADGAAAFTTDDFWHKMPGVAVTVLTFAVCGFGIVYFLGTRSFCNYVCPYGAVFAAADRLAPARIRVTDACITCAKCTAACPTGVRVHEEVKQHGMVVNPACMKDLDCIAACPEDALYFGLGKPALFASRGDRARFGLPYSLTWAEEIVVAIVFVVATLVFRGLYNVIPFFLSLALAGIVGYLVILALRLVTRADASFSKTKLKTNGRITAAGVAYFAVFCALGAMLAHCAFIRYHEYLGLSRPIVDAPVDESRVLLAQSHLNTARRWGLMENELVTARLAQIAIHFAQRSLQSDDTTGAIAQLRAATNLEPSRAALRVELGNLLAEAGDFDGAIASLNEGIRLDPKVGGAEYNLGTILAHLGQFADAVPHYERAIELSPDDADVWNNLGFALMRLRRMDDAQTRFERAIAIAPENANAHFNLATLLAAIDEPALAQKHLEIAARLDPRYAEWLESSRSDTSEDNP